MLQRNLDDFGSSIKIDRDAVSGEPVVLGSGCVAQVFRGEFRPSAQSSHSGASDDAVIQVAVKVTHPNIRDAIVADIRLLKLFAGLIEALLPGSRTISLSESVQEFEALMLDQLDMRKEAHNLLAFRKNFMEESNKSEGSKLKEFFDRLKEYIWGGRQTESGNMSVRHRVSFPQPLLDLTCPEILVETCERGPLLSHLMLADEDGRTTLDDHTKKEIAQIGLHAIFKMIFIDNFIHAGDNKSNFFF